MMRKKIIIVLLIALETAVIAVFARNPLRQSEQACMMDGLRYVIWPRCSVVLILLMCITFVLITSKRRNVIQIMKMNSRRKIWNKDCVNTLKISAIFSALVVVITLSICNVYYNGQLMNWSQRDSFYSQYIGRDLENVSIIKIILIAYLIIFLQTYFSLQWLLISKVIFYTDIWGLISLIIVGFNDLNDFGISILYGRFTVRRDLWFSLDFSNFLYLILLAVIILVSYFYGRFKAEKRDFL